MKLIVAYDGTDYFGWQKNNMGPTIEGELERVLKQILQEPIHLDASSRTDRGVHAAGQVVSLKISSNPNRYKLIHALNGLLPKDIRVRKIIDNDLEPIGKEYIYRICMTPVQLPMNRRTSWHFPGPLNLDLMNEAARRLAARRDFTGFETKCADPSPCKNRELYSISITPSDEGLLITVKGKSFLYKMVRTLVGTLAYVGAGKIPLSGVESISKRSEAGMTAPAHGLTLNKMLYDFKE